MKILYNQVRRVITAKSNV